MGVGPIVAPFYLCDLGKLCNALSLIPFGSKENNNTGLLEVL